MRAGNFMAMRRAAYARPVKSAKLNRLREIVEEEQVRLGAVRTESAGHP
ncbi:hypothetical protein [Streptomyces sp. NPDC059564]